MPETQIATAFAPAHVPPHLVRDFQFESLPGADVDIVQAALDATRGGPDIFYALRSRQGANAWIVTRHELMLEIFQDPGRFSSHNNVNFSALAGETWPTLPLELDPPEHGSWRMLLNPIFAPKRMAALESDIVDLARRLVDRLAEDGEAEFVDSFALVFPVQIFLSLFGLPLDHTDRFLKWENDLIHGHTMEDRQNGAKAIVAYLREVIAARRVTPTEDLISYVVTSQVNGNAVTDDEAMGVCVLLYVAGLDTVANMLGYIFKYLAEHPEDQQKLRDDPALIPNAVEELLRAFPIVVNSRTVTHDLEFHGIAMKTGDIVVLPTALAGRDEREFPEPDKIDFQREKISHISFASGPHRCIGSHLARRELRIAIEEWLKRIPPFRVKPGERPVTQGFGVFGVVSLPLVW